MSVELRRKSRIYAAWRAALWASVAIVAGLLYLRSNPWTIETDIEVTQGEEITREAESDVIVVLDYAAIAKSPAHFERHDWSAAWINIIEQEVGPVSIATPQSLSAKVLNDSRVVILTASVSRSVGPELMRRLDGHLDRGGTLVIERPGGALRKAWGADGHAGSRRGARFTFARGLTEPYASELRSIPLSTDYIGSTGARPGAETMLSIDGAPVLYVTQAKKGTVVVVDFDIGEVLVSLQQGRPDDPSTFEMRTREAHGSPRVEDLVSVDDLIGSKVPMADLLERFVVHGVIAPRSALPTLWVHPSGASGTVIGVHEDSSLGDGGGWMLDYEKERGSVSTLLTSIDAQMSAAAATTHHRKGGDIGLLWHMPHTPAQLTESVGIAGFEPMARPLSLSSQLDQLTQKLPVGYVRSSRVAGGWWGPSWAAPFEQLAAQGCRIDMSYETPHTSGYAFGTGFPFLALGKHGRPLGIRELPIIVPDGAIKGPSFEELLESSAQGHHMAMGFALDPASFADYPDREKFESWLSIFDLIEDKKHVMTSAYQYDEFMRSRRASSARSQLVRRASMPAPSIPSLDEDDEVTVVPRREATLMRLTIESKGRGIWAMVPETLDERPFTLAKKRSGREGAGGADLDVRRLSLIGIPMVLVPLERGFNTIDLFYGEE